MEITVRITLSNDEADLIKAAVEQCIGGSEPPDFEPADFVHDPELQLRLDNHNEWVKFANALCVRIDKAQRRGK